MAVISSFLKRCASAKDFGFSMQRNITGKSYRSWYLGISEALKKLFSMPSLKQRSRPITLTCPRSPVVIPCLWSSQDTKKHISLCHVTTLWKGMYTAFIYFLFVYHFHLVVGSNPEVVINPNINVHVLRYFGVTFSTFTIRPPTISDLLIWSGNQK